MAYKWGLLFTNWDDPPSRTCVSLDVAFFFFLTTHLVGMGFSDFHTKLVPSFLAGLFPQQWLMYIIIISLFLSNLLSK